ncbi:MAG: hypothetical protein NTX52_04705, partial [Planctomycetota bacterium]|nr:hypothetical protein [Planctomycetota bacterium]
SCPGWSAYWYMGDISKDKGIMRNVKKTDAVCWAIPESLILKPNYDEKSWYDALVDVLRYENCKYICFNNWEGAMLEQDGKKSRVVEATKRAIKNYKRSPVLGN